MLTPERHQMILSLVKEKNIVKLAELVEATATSESTIRRDLSQLEQMRKLKRVHGGAASLHQKGEEPSLIEKTALNLTQKEKIAQYAAQLVADGDCIYLDAGTSTFAMIPYLKAKEIKVVTNGLTHIGALLEHGIDAYVLGGHVKQKTQALIGTLALESLQHYFFDKSFIGTNGVHQQFGLTTPDPEEAAVKRLAISRAQDAYVLADYSKFREVTFAKIADVHEVEIITDDSSEEMIHELREDATITVVR